jgi:hypothetical protein
MVMLLVEASLRPQAAAMSADSAKGEAEGASECRGERTGEGLEG